MLSIVWVNRGSAGSDTDMFGAVYGVMAAVARQNVDRAIDNWNSVIRDFNYDGDGNPATDNVYSLTVVAADLGGTLRGQSNITNIDGNGLPASATITMDDAGGAGGWFIDPTPLGDDEFLFPVNAFQANSNQTGNDFFRTAAHEIGHAVGISTDGALAINNFLTPAGTDQVSGADNLNVFQNLTGQFGIPITLTDASGRHTYEGPVDPGFPGAPIHPNDLMNPGRTVGPPATRQFVTDLNAMLLADAYGYTVRLPSVTSFTIIGPDALEDNDTQQTATVLGSLSQVTINDVTIFDAGDIDFYRYTAPATGRMEVRAFFIHGPGNDIDVRLRDANGNVITPAGQGSSTSDDEFIFAPVVAGEAYFIEVFGAGGSINDYDLEIETFSAPIPNAVILNPEHDSGLSNLDAVTFVPDPQVFIQADLFHFADVDSSEGLSIAENALLSSADVEVFVNGVSQGFATVVPGTNSTLYSFNIPTAALDGGVPFLGGLLNLVSAAVRITDGQQPTPASGRTMLSEPLRLIRGDVDGPVVTGIEITDVPDYDLFAPKPSDGPTPSINSLTIRFEDGPDRFAGFLQDALNANIAQNTGNYLLVGDANGVIPIVQAIVTNDPPNVGDPALATVELVFGMPLPDDRYTLTVFDEIVDLAGNRLDGEANTTFPSGNGISGGDFVFQFNVDTAAEIGTWSGGSVYLDLNGNYVFDPHNADAANRDVALTLGFATDLIFAGNFHDPDEPIQIANGYDKLAAYGLANGQYRWLIDFTGVLGEFAVFTEPTGFNGTGTPIAGNFDGNPDNGDEIGLFTGTQWIFDTDRDFLLSDEVRLSTPLRGLPVVGDFDADGEDDLATWDATTNTFYFSETDFGGGPTNPVQTFSFRIGNGFPFLGARDRPVAGDVDGDGFDEIGLFVPDRSGVPPQEAAEWYFLSSVEQQGVTNVARDFGRFEFGSFVLDFIPKPFGPDIFAQFGDEFALPIVGNFDPPSAIGIPDLPGDYNSDDTVDLADRDVWADTFGSTTHLDADGNSDNRINAADFVIWRDHLGAGQAVSGTAVAASTAIGGKSAESATTTTNDSRSFAPLDRAFASMGSSQRRSPTQQTSDSAPRDNAALLLLLAEGRSATSDEPGSRDLFETLFDSEEESESESLELVALPL